MVAKTVQLVMLSLRMNEGGQFTMFQLAVRNVTKTLLWASTSHVTRLKTIVAQTLFSHKLVSFFVKLSFKQMATGSTSG